MKKLVNYQVRQGLVNFLDLSDEKKTKFIKEELNGELKTFKSLMGKIKENTKASLLYLKIKNMGPEPKENDKQEQLSIDLDALDQKQLENDLKIVNKVEDFLYSKYGYGNRI